jgi:uncharacterized membrane protein YfcA
MMPIAVIVTFAFLLAGTAKGLTGLGLSTFAIGVLGVVMPPSQAAALQLVPALLTNVWQMGGISTLSPIAKRFGLMTVCVFLGTFLGIEQIKGGNAQYASTALGAVIVLYGATGLLTVGYAIKPATERWLSPVVGLLTGVVTGATGVFVIPVVPYLSSLGMSREELVQTLGLSFTVSTLALGAGLWAGGGLQVSTVQNSLFALVPAFVGMVLGQRIRRRLQPSAFRKWFHIGMVALGTCILVRANMFQ